MAALTERDLKRILTLEERNAITIVGGAKNTTDLELIARRMSLDPVRLRALVERARTKVASEARKPTMEEVKCVCGQDFTPRHKGQLLCPACVELNGDGRPLTEQRSNGRSDHREPDHESAHESAHEGGSAFPPERNFPDRKVAAEAPEASPGEAPDNDDVARNPPPARPFRQDEDVQARRARIIAALAESVEDELSPRAIAAATGLDMPTTQNDLMRLLKAGAVVRRRLERGRVAYHLPRDDDVNDQETLDVGDHAATEPAPDLARPAHSQTLPRHEHVPIDELRQRAADTAKQLMEEAERLADAADMAVPETLLRARYIAALLSCVEAGDTSPDLLDRFERLAFGGEA